MPELKNPQADSDILYEMICSSTITFLQDNGAYPIQTQISKIEQYPSWFTIANSTLEELSIEVKNRFGGKTIYVVGSFKEGFYYVIKKSAPL